MDFRSLIKHKNNQYCTHSGCNCHRKYERMQEDATVPLIPCGSSGQSSSESVETQQQLKFYEENSTECHKVIVEQKLNAHDVCRLLALRVNRPQDDSDSTRFSIVECWEGYSADYAFMRSQILDCRTFYLHFCLERYIEDHEYVLSAYKTSKDFSKPNNKFKYILRKQDCSKYDFLDRPEMYFRRSMVCFSLSDQSLVGSEEDYKRNLGGIVQRDSYVPVIHSRVEIFNPDSKDYCFRQMILIQDTLYTMADVTVANDFIKAVVKSSNPKIAAAKIQQTEKYAVLKDFYVYSARNGLHELKKLPKPWAIILRPIIAETDDDKARVCCFICSSSAERTCWLHAMRLAKYGKQIRENYKALKSKKTEYGSNVRPDAGILNPNESGRFSGRVAMDFTGPVSRIVEDPVEANAIAMSEGYSWKRRWRPTARSTDSAQRGSNEAWVYLGEPWYHGKLSRTEATETLSGSSEGTFLVRDSQSSPNSFVLSYKYNGKVNHAQITYHPIPGQKNNAVSLDNGTTKFASIDNLIEFYKLNKGSLPVMLTNYVYITSPSSTVAP